MDARAEIERRRLQFEAAFNREDVAALCELCGEDLVMMPANQPPIVGLAEAVEWWRTGFEAFRTAFQLVPHELYMSDDWAFDWVDWDMTVVPLCGMGGEADSGSAFWIWRLQQDRAWRIVRAMWKSHSEAPSVWAGGVGYFLDAGFPLM